LGIKSYSKDELNESEVLKTSEQLVVDVKELTSKDFIAEVKI